MVSPPGNAIASSTVMLSRFRVPLSWGTLFTRMFKEAIADDVLNLAAQQAYYFFFALFPALLALLSIASFFPVHNLVDEVVTMFGRVAPPEVITIVTEQLGKISSTNAGGLLTFAFVITLWSTSNAVVSMCSTLNAAYDITESRPWWKVRAIAIGLTVGLAFFILVAMTLIVAGPTLAERIAQTMGLGPVFAWTWKVLQWPLIFVMVSAGIAMVYYFAPDAEQDWVWITPGSIVATALWLLISLGFKFYLARFGSYEAYGAIGSVMVMMLWFYLSGLAILVGAEMNAEIEHASPYGKNPGERVPGQRKKIGIAAERDYDERKARGALEVNPLPDGVNCDVDLPPVHRAKGIKPSDLLIGAAALLPAAVKIGRDVKRRLASKSVTSGDRTA
jgi:membrane protein